MSEEQPRRRKRYHQGACLVCGRFLKPYGDGWETSIHAACADRTSWSAR